ncbi:MAG: hypothetical protein PHS60_15395 [Zavarzinia sp.]|nr:hypothetical protein [Zavarzinia sp.]
MTHSIEIDITTAIAEQTRAIAERLGISEEEVVQRAISRYHHDVFGPEAFGDVTDEERAELERQGRTSATPKEELIRQIDAQAAEIGVGEIGE